LKKIACFGLTEPDNGSDATNMQTTARKVEGGYIINGRKRWPGNGSIADLTIVWAKNVSDGNKIQGFVVEKGMKGHSATAIPNKVATRMVANGDILLNDVFVPYNNRLAKADSFETGLNANLMSSRLLITWIFVGAMAGAFEAAYHYTMNRKQFGKPIAGF
jgi:acyl-CoA oxidase